MDVGRTPECLIDIVRGSPDDEQVREAAIRLGELRYEPAVPVLIELLQHVKDPLLRDAAALALHDLADQRALWPLVDAIRDNPRNRDTLLFSLQALDCSEIVEFLVDVFLESGFSSQLAAFGCLENARLASVPAEVKQRCIERVQRAMEGTEDPSHVERLTWLLEELQS